MKSVFTLLWAWVVLASTSAWSQNTSALFLTTTENEAFYASINGMVINEVPVRNLFITSLPAGNYILEYSVLRPGVSPSTHVQELTLIRGTESTYKLERNNQDMVSVFALNKTMGLGIAVHTQHPSYNLALIPGGSWANGQFTVTKVVRNGVDPFAMKWNDLNGWPDMQPPPPPPPPAENLGPDVTCINPVNETDFKAIVLRIQAKTIEGTKLAIAKDIVEQNCFTSAQVKSLLDLFAVDDSRVQLGKLAWHHLNDPKNWSLVYDAFTYGEKIDELRTYVRSHPLKETVVVAPPVDTVVTIKPPPRPMPPVYAIQGYTGKIGCEWPMSDGDFNNLKNTVKSKSFASEQMTLIQQGLKDNCITTAQTKSLAELFTFDSDRMKVVQMGWDHCYDLDNFYQVNELFTWESSSEELTRYMNAHPRAAVTPPTVVPQAKTGCPAPMDAAAFTALKNSISKATSSGTKLTILKQGAASACLSVAQIKEVVGLFTWDSEKIDAAKFLWKRSFDYQNFYQVTQLFTSSFSQEDLNNYLKANPR